MEPRNYQSGAAGSAPAAEASPSTGYPTDGDPATAVPATVPGAAWFHQIGAEIRQVIVGAGLTPSDADLTQLDTAIASLIAGATPDASETTKGIIELATAAEVQAGTDAFRGVTPAGLASFSKSLITQGYQKLPGGLIVQWGAYTPAAGAELYSFPIAYPTSVFAISGSINRDDHIAYLMNTAIISNSQFRIRTHGPSGTAGSTPVFVISVGY